jgi:hypothetical protein
VVAMVVDPQAAFDQRGNALGGPELRAVAVGQCPLGQQPHEARLLVRGEPGRPAGGRLGRQRRWPARVQRIAPPEHAARVAPEAAGDLMQGQLLFEERDHPLPPRLERLGRTARSHGDPSFPEGSMILHYLCGCQ